jgi:hypothetical protein
VPPLHIPPDRFTVSVTETTITRRCPFCEGTVEESLGTNIDFIVHMGSPIPKHTSRQAWADYLGYMNRI